jgi:hypothetical protein
MPAMPRETRHFPLVAVATLAFAFAGAFAGPALAKDPGDEAYTMRMMACAGEGVSMEVYLPQSVVFGKKPLQQTLAQPVIGYYALEASANFQQFPKRRRCGNYARHTSISCLLTFPLVSFYLWG